MLLDLLPFIIGGLATGAVYGLAGTGLVLTYKTSGIFNFGYGAMATIAAYVFYFLHVDLELDWVTSAVISVLIIGPVLGLAMEPLARMLARQPLTFKVVGTVGLLVAVQGIGTLLYGPTTIPVDQFLPNGSDTIEVLGANIGIDQIILAASSLLLTLVLYCVFRFSTLGIRMRAVVDDPDLLAIEGTNPSRSAGSHGSRARPLPRTPACWCSRSSVWTRTS